jgi:exonuclease SbcC
LQQKQSEYQSLNTALSAVSIQDVENEKSSLDTSIEDLIAATAHWKLLFQAITEKDTLQKSLEKNRKAQEQSTAQFVEAEKLLEIRTGERAASLKMLEKAKLVAAESVERLRNQLEPEEPCPVCGSTDHPYASHHPGLDLVLSELETGHAQVEASYTQQLTLYTRLKQSCTELGKVIGELEDKTSQNDKSLKELETTWSEFQVSEKCNEHPFGERTTWLQEQLQQQRTRQQQLQAQIQSYTKQKEQLEAHKTQLTALDKQLNQIENQIKDAERILKSSEEQQKSYTTEQGNIHKKLDEIAQALAVYFSSEHWFENWQSNPDAFVTHIREFAREWKVNITQLEEHIRKQAILTEKKKGMQEQHKNTREEVQINEQKLSRLQAQSKDLFDKRVSIFSGTPVKEMETKLKDAISSAKQILEEQRKAVEKIQGDITRNRAQHEHLEKDINGLSKQESELKYQLTEWITKYNQKHKTSLTQKELLPLLAFTQDWIETERASLRAIDDMVTQAKSILEERTKALATHIGQRPSERTSEELTALRAEMQELLKQHTQQANEIDFKVKEDTLNKQRIGTLLQDIERQAAIVENWAKLNEIIGSADGKKFRQIAQEYTLDVLLSYANVHLEVLSKRYVLQRIPNSLGLQVIDQDMGDEVRTVYSLSGGESFLVSLALALGLASLSSSRMKVESLFIDEGFGSLDSTTLNIAMDALERLHNQGRKVGVISHVQEMTERIPVQIKVSKQQSGKSKVEVIGI